MNNLWWHSGRLKIGSSLGLFLVKMSSLLTFLVIGSFIIAGQRNPVLIGPVTSKAVEIFFFRGIIIVLRGFLLALPCQKSQILSFFQLF